MIDVIIISSGASSYRREGKAPPHAPLLKIWRSPGWECQTIAYYTAIGIM